MSGGRPSAFSQAQADLICEEIANGRSLRSICADPSMPSKAAVFRWLASQEEFRDQYARAREAQADALADEILDIADDGANDTFTDEDGRERVNSDVIARSRLRVDARKWVAAKLKPRVYGDRIATELSGVEGRPIEHRVIERVIVDPQEPVAE
jgi:hypothetical protein